MHLDHLSFAAGPDGLDATTARLADLLGVPWFDGGVHPRFGTLNRLFPLRGGQYVEVVAVLDHPASDKAPFGQAVRARSDMGGGWLGWVVRVDDMAPVEKRMGRHAVPGNRRRPDGFNLRWRQIGVRGTQADPQLPFVVQWDVDADEHPSRVGPAQAGLVSLEIAGDPGRVTDYLGESVLEALEDVDVQWVAPNGIPGIVAATFATPDGDVRV
ncbi:glyoxalase-like protein [Mumia flava]|uniref:Glyoxalase-like protein n=1 Tax=Mumia flava TaxID=1348852 RepID=A0A0B2BV37_9ACTN|nr:VOC family protein [Mumia flava]PJJ58155.1 glyoxalase-like protein [Mumia flava]